MAARAQAGSLYYDWEDLQEAKSETSKEFRRRALIHKAIDALIAVVRISQLPCSLGAQTKTLNAYCDIRKLEKLFLKMNDYFFRYSSYYDTDDSRTMRLELANYVTEFRQCLKFDALEKDMPAERFLRLQSGLNATIAYLKDETKQSREQFSFEDLPEIFGYKISDIFETRRAKGAYR